MLHNHSVFSVIDSKATIEDYLKLAVADGQQFFALTDHGSLGGSIELYTQAKKLGIKPVIGMELYCDAYELRERNYPGHLTILARSESGYRSLIAANNLAHRQFYYRPRITLKQLIDGGYCRDWIILSGCQSSILYDYPQVETEVIIKQLKEHSAGFFLEVMWHHSEDEQFNVKQDLYHERIAALHKSLDIPLALTNDCHYAHKHQEDIHMKLLRESHAPSDLEFDGEGFYFKSLKQMQAISDALGIPDALANSIDIGQSCDLVIPEADKINWHVPDITLGRPLERLNELAQPRLLGLSDEYRVRYEYELSVLKTSSAILNSYLVTHDVVAWCSNRNIPVAARGSMAGSLVSYLLGITVEDPIKYNLSFSRAVNPARPTIPDFDLDVSSIHRAEILDYLKERYEGNIPIAAYTHYGPKGALRKVLRMEGLRDMQSVNELCKQLPDDWAEGDFEYSPGQHKYIGNVPWFENIPEQYRDAVSIYRGVYSSLSVHPSGVLVSGPERKLEHEVPLQWIASSKVMASAFDMYTLKKMGLFKLDVLGLRTLDQLAYMEHVSGEKVPNDDYDEPEVLAAFGADLLAEIFQMDGYACREVIKNIRGIETFEDIIAANTLARPGCSQFTPFYRSGYENLLNQYPSLKEILGPTNGLILYQEQVMEISRILAEFDDAEQDDVKESIKYFNHKNWENTIEPLFRSRCEAKGIDATNILEAISKMASYTYNRAHAMTYAALAYKMMWYKVHHPAVYYAAVYDGAEDKNRLVLESHFFGVKWHPADVNVSESNTVVKDGEILLGLSAIKGVGPAAVEALTKARPFTSLEDLEERVERRRCNKRVIGAMKEAFALTCIGETGTYTAFQEAFGFNYRFLNSDLSKELAVWQTQDPAYRLGGFVIDMRISKIQRIGPNQGKEMMRAKIVNIKGSKNAVFFPDVWKKAAGVMYQGAAIKLQGEFQTSGDFIVAKGEAV